MLRCNKLGISLSPFGLAAYKTHYQLFQAKHAAVEDKILFTAIQEKIYDCATDIGNKQFLGGISLRLLTCLHHIEP
jgi:hypothetical protein